MSTRLSICRFAFALALCGAMVTAHADGSDDAAATRKACQAQGADTPAKLQTCCADQILADPLSKQRRLEKECVTGVAQPKDAKELAADERAKAARQADQPASGTATSDSNPPAPATAGSPTPPAAAAPAPATAPAASTTSAAKPTVTDVVNKCNSSQTHQAISSLGSLARRFGAKVPNTDCP
jgi:cell division septation protein DedD